MSKSEWNKSKIDTVVQGFLDGSLTETQWTHQAHLVICLYHIMTYDFYDAALRIKLGIISYNQAIGLENTIERGYHETLTLFWIWAVNAFLVGKEDRSLESNILELLESPFSKKYLPFFFYSEGHIFSHKARVKWVEPDERPLDAKAIIEEYPSSIWFG